MFSLDEQEININKVRSEDKFVVYTNDTTWLTKLLKFAEPVDSYKNEEGKIVSATFELEKNQITIRKPSKKREMTEEQKLAAAERMRKFHESRMTE